MPKILSDAVYTALKQKADNYDTVVNAVVSNNEGLTAEDVTAELITEALTASGNNENTELQSQLDAAVQRAETAESRVEELETENANLRGAPAGKTAGLNADGGEPGGEAESIEKFADKNAGNTAAILEQMKKEGLI